MEGIISLLGTKAATSEVRAISKDLSKFVTNQEIEGVWDQLNQKAEKTSVRNLQDQLRDINRKIEKDVLSHSKRSEFLGKEIQQTRVGLSQVMQKIAEKAERVDVDSQMRLIKELQRFDAKQFKQEICSEANNQRGNFLFENLIKIRYF